MNEKNHIELKTNCIRNIPLNCYEDFTFIINGTEFKTNKLISDLLSSKIGRTHRSDPTFDSITINTKEKGHFSYILKLTSFAPISIPENEIPFITEIVEQLENEWIEFKRYDQMHEITMDNVFSLVLQHEKFSDFYKNFFEKEIDFIASNFYKLDDEKQKIIMEFLPSTIERIIDNENLRIEDEDQLLKFINKLYLNDQQNSILYEYVNFVNVDSETVEEFIKIFNMNNINRNLWDLLSKRLTLDSTYQKVYVSNRYTQTKKFIKKELTFSYNDDLKFNGILNYLKNLSNGNINDEVSITSSSVCDACLPQNAVAYDDPNLTFQSNVELSSWICFDFRKRRIIPSSYLIKSYFCNKNMNHPKSWVIEGSNDNFNWETLDNEQNCTYLNGNNLVHSFSISDAIAKPFQYIRMRLTGKNWNGVIALRIDSFEIYGNLL